MAIPRDAELGCWASADVSELALAACSIHTILASNVNWFTCEWAAIAALSHIVSSDTALSAVQTSRRFNCRAPHIATIENKQHRT